jgi:hypothetical protein
VLRLRNAWPFSPDLVSATPASFPNAREDPMRTKLKLNLDQLSVDSFDTTKPAAKAGTVFGEQCTCDTACTCPGCPSCYESCDATCGDTCPATCAYTCDDATCGYSACDGGCGTPAWTNCWKCVDP